MPEIMGYEEYGFIGEETTFGTAASSMSYMHVDSNGITEQHQDRELEEHLGQPDDIDDVPDKLVIGGTLNGAAYGIGPVTIEQLWSWAYTRTSGQLKSLTWEWAGGLDPLRFLGLRINEFTIEASADNPIVRWNAAMVGRDSAVLGSPPAVPDPDPYADSSSRAGGPMVFQDGSSLFEIDDVATKLAGFKFTIRNNLDQWFLGTKSSSAPDYQIIEASRPGRRKISGELLLVPTTNAFNVKVRGRTRWKTELGIQGYKNSTTDRRGVFTIASCLPRGYQWQRNLDQAGRLTVPFGSRRLGATASISATWSDVVV